MFKKIFGIKRFPDPNFTHFSLSDKQKSTEGLGPTFLWFYAQGDN